jgi:hypothetical protein
MTAATAKPSGAGVHPEREAGSSSAATRLGRVPGDPDLASHGAIQPRTVMEGPPYAGSGSPAGRVRGVICPLTARGVEVNRWPGSWSGWTRPAGRSGR